jgi:hypothetical protein
VVLDGARTAAPFEPNQLWYTLLALVRWVGSPVSSLANVFWNIDLTGRCALLVDLASRYEVMPPQGSRFADVRNAAIILSAMDQYSLSAEILPHRDGLQREWDAAIPVERLIRVALLAHFDVPDPKAPWRMTTMAALRSKLARAILIRRRRGVVPNILTYFWFLFAVAISIQACKTPASPSCTEVCH